MQPWNFKGTGKFREGNKSGVINLEFLACYSWIWRQRDILCWQKRWSRVLLPKHTGHLAVASDSSNSRAQTPRDSKVHKTQSGHRLSREGPVLWGLSENMRQFYLKAKVGKSDQRVPATEIISAWLPHLNCLSWRLLTTHMHAHHHTKPAFCLALPGGRLRGSGESRWSLDGRPSRAACSNMVGRAPLCCCQK